MFIGELIGAAGSLAGGLLGSSANKEASDQDWKRQKKVLQNSISWRVADAKRAGIHPLYAMGAPTSSFTSTIAGSDPIGNALQNMGQDVGRAVNSYMSKDQRAADMMSQLALERGELENELLRSQIRRNNAPGTGPGLSSDGTVTFGGGEPLKLGPTTPAQDLEQQYGELAGDMGGLYRFGMDWLRQEGERTFGFDPTTLPSPQSLGASHGNWLRSKILELARRYQDRMSASHSDATYYKNNAGREYW
ncbi:putative VP2 [Microviridae sp.]|nr:putative VP2 [Microviridae sp.]